MLCACLGRSSREPNFTITLTIEQLDCKILYGLDNFSVALIPNTRYNGLTVDEEIENVHL
jgi:hypothetical protein